MLDHLSISVSDFHRSGIFYDAVLRTLGYARVFESAAAIGYAPPGLDDDPFAIRTGTSPYVPPQEMHIAFTARSRDAVIRFHETAVSLGATSDGEPQLHPIYGEGYFAAFVIDPDGYRLEAVYHEPVIRTRIDRDVSQCITALQHVHKFDGYPSAWPPDPRSWLTPEGLLHAWVARIGSSVVGHIAIGEVDPLESPHFVAADARESKSVEVKRLFVVPSARGLGIANALLATAVTYIRAKRHRPVLEVTADRKAAIRLYERAGWKRIGTAPAGWLRASGERPVVHHYLWTPEVKRAPGER